MFQLIFEFFEYILSSAPLFERIFNIEILDRLADYGRGSSANVTMRNIMMIKPICIIG
jgi:hypothetical protein